MPDPATQTTRRVLDPSDRLAEVLFGLIMVLTFTGSLSVAETGRDDVRAMLIGALGCNLAWGVIDAVLFLLGNLAERGRGLTMLHALRSTADKQLAHRLIADALPGVVADVLEPVELESIRERLMRLPEPPKRARWGRDDWLGAAGVFLLVFFATFPVVIPFMVLSDVQTAMRVSNLIAIALLFVTGYFYGCLTRRRPWVVGASMVVLGGVLVGLTIALGG